MDPLFLNAKDRSRAPNHSRFCGGGISLLMLRRKVRVVAWNERIRKGREGESKAR